jgi:hypothetical protein
MGDDGWTSCSSDVYAVKEEKGTKVQKQQNRLGRNEQYAVRGCERILRTGMKKEEELEKISDGRYNGMRKLFQLEYNPNL